MHYLLPIVECSEPPRMFLPHIVPCEYIMEDITGNVNESRIRDLIRHQSSQKDLGL